MGTDGLPPEPEPILRWPWTLTLGVLHLGGPPFDLDKYAAEVEDLVIEYVRNMRFELPGGTTIHVEANIDRTDTPAHGLEAHR